MSGELSDVLKHSAQWLLAQQEDKSGGWGQNKGDDINSLNTAEAVLAVLDAGVGVEPGHLQLVKAKNFLVRMQSSDPSSQGAWTRTVDRGAAELPDVLRTSFALQALVRLGVSATDEIIEKALTWLRQRRAPDGGWGHQGSDESQILLTCHALLAVIAVAVARNESQGPEREVYNEFVVPARNWLLTNVQGDGSIGAPGPLQAAHTILAVMALQCLRRCGFEVVQDHEHRALRWLVDNPDKSMDLVEEDVVLDPSDAQHNYAFLYMTDALLVEVLYAADQKQSGMEPLAEDALLRLKARQDGRGGFYGNRVFSWSTAKCISALREVDRDRSDFPILTSSPEKAGRRTSAVIIVTAAMLWMGALLLALFDKFSPTLGIFGLFLLLAMLVTLRVISEKTFAKVAGLGIGNIGTSR